MRRTTIGIGAALSAGALVLTGCSASVDNTVAAAPSASGAAPAATVDDGGCTKNHDKIAKIQADLATNLYGIAAAESDKGTNTDPEPIAAGDKIKITFSIEGLSHPFLVAQKAAAEAAAAQAGAEINVVSANDDVNKQFNDVQTAISQGTSALMMMPANTQGLDAVLNQASTKGVPYFFTQKGMLGVKPASQVLAPYANEGAQLGTWVAEHYKSKDNVNVLLVSGITGDASSVARTGAFETELLKACNFTILAEQPGQYRRQESAKAAETMLTANKDVQLIFGANDEAALGALSALETAGRSGVDIVGLDGEKDMFTAIEQGKALATVIHKPTAGIVVEEIVKYLKGEPVPQFKVLDEDLVTKEAITAGTVKPAF